jgi:hypothetical protein
VPNLFLAGRCISTTHVALGTTRVMNTGGLMGAAVGKAAALCKRHGCLPREVYERHLDEFREALRQPVGGVDKGGRPIGGQS